MLSVLVEQQVAGKYSNPYKFNAKELDSETALYYYGARYYNPRLSIWYGVDPLAEKYPSWSPYAYTFNNPIIFTDPDGRDPRPGMLILSYRGYLGGWNVSSQRTMSTSFNLAYGLSKYTTMNYPISGVQVNIGFDSFYFKDRATAWAYIKAINNLNAINNNEAHHATFNRSVKIGSKTYDTSQQPQNFDDGYATGQAISELGCNCGAVMMGAMGSISTVRRGTLEFSDKVSPQKMLRHIEGTAPSNKSYVNSMEDAQAVLDAYNSGNYRLISENVSKNTVVIEVKNVTGRYVNTNNPNGRPDINVPTNKFMIQSTNSPKVVPVKPKK